MRLHLFYLLCCYMLVIMVFIRTAQEPAGLFPYPHKDPATYCCYYDHVILIRHLLYHVIRTLLLSMKWSWETMQSCTVFQKESMANTQKRLTHSWFKHQNECTISARKPERKWRSGSKHSITQSSLNHVKSDRNDCQSFRPWHECRSHRLIQQAVLNCIEIREFITDSVLFELRCHAGLLNY